VRVEVLSTGQAGREELVLSPRLDAQVSLFQDLLESLCASSVEDLAGQASVLPAFPSCQSVDGVIVQPGDCLSMLCAAELRRRGSGTSWREIRAAVQAVAEDNHIQDPDRILAGKALDLSGLAPGGEGGTAAPETSQAWNSLVGGAGRLSSAFGSRKDPFSGLVRQHNGIDIAAPAGTSIRAFRSGEVVFAGWKPGYGNTVVLRHEDGTESLYGHLSKSLVQVGDRVTGHAAIACVGSTGRSTGAHLHFEVRRAGRAVDPMPLLDGGLPGFA